MTRSRVAFAIALAASLAAGSAPGQSARAQAPASPHRQGRATEAAAQRRSDENPTAPSRRLRGVVHLEAAQQAMLGVRVAPLRSAEVRPEVHAYGRVLNPAGLAEAVAALDAARAAAEASRRELARATRLHESDRNVSTAALEQARAQAAADRARLHQTQARLLASWGPAIAGRRDLRAFVEGLLRRDRVLIRLNVAPGARLDAPPRRVRVTFGGLEGQSVVATFIGTAPDVDPRLQGPGFFYLARATSPGLAPGAFVRARLARGGSPLHGTVVPASAVLHARGATWVYVRSSPGTFVRRRVTLGPRVEGGTLATTGPPAGIPVVVAGAMELWAREGASPTGEMPEAD